MITYTRFRLQRLLRRYGRWIRRGWRLGIRYLTFNLFGKWRQLAMIRRFAFIWWFIVLASIVGLSWQIRDLRSQGMVLQALPGGTYSEALVGSAKILNPILPENSATADINHLIFSGLTRFNTNGDIEPDLAQSWVVSPDGRTYTFKLRRNVTWHDGVPFTAEDVVFTLAAIQNPDTRSPLSSSWQGVKVAAPDSYTVVFTLPKPYTPFMNATTVGVLPRHLLENTDPSALRVSTFNQHPVGTGPFKMNTFDSAGGEVSLDANKAYYFGKPLIDSVVFRLYDTADKAFSAYNHRQVLGVGRIEPDQIASARKLGTLKLYEASVPDEVAVFMKTTSPILNDKAVRTALAEATDRQSLIQSQLGTEAVSLEGPLLPSTLKLGALPRQPALNSAKASADLEAAGWKKGSDGIRAKGATKLELHLVTQQDTAYPGVAQELAKQWQKIGVKLDIATYDSSTLRQSYIRTRHYDLLLYGINTGADPDVYSYWDSSQIKDPGLNLSDYSSAAVDKALEAGRTVQDPNTRAAKYRAFVQAWVADTPAIMLYTPLYAYGVDESVHGVHIHRLVNPSDRFTGIESWSVRVKAVPLNSHP